jgi:hypothetical protein
MNVIVKRVSLPRKIKLPWAHFTEVKEFSVDGSGLPENTAVTLRPDGMVMLSDKTGNQVILVPVSACVLYAETTVLELQHGK